MEQLTLVERNDLQYLEQQIEQWSEQTEKAADAFKRIRDSRLYRGTHKRFEDYCRERWGHTRQHINRLIKSTEIIGELEMEPMGSKITSERQARELAKVEPERRPHLPEPATGDRIPSMDPPDISGLDPNDSSGKTLEILMRRQHGDKAVDKLKAECEAKGLTLRELVELAVREAMDEASEGN